MTEELKFLGHMWNMWRSWHRTRGKPGYPNQEKLYERIRERVKAKEKEE